MNASKEEAQCALALLYTAADYLDTERLDDIDVHAVKQKLVKVEAFIEAAMKKLPSEAAYTKDKARRGT